MKHISMDDLHELLPQIGPMDLILDVRTAEEYASGHVPRSKNISHTDIAQNVQGLQGYNHIYIYCQAGRRSQIAAMELEKNGFRNLICVSSAGMGHWVASGFPVET